MKKILIGTAMLTLLGAGCQNTVNTEPQESVSTVEEPSTVDYVHGETFRDPESGISFSLPLDADFVEVNESGEALEKMVSFRIQNYDPSGPEKLILNENEYYIELWIDYSEPSNLETCTSRLSSIETVEANEGTRYMGDPGQGGDSGGERYGICFNGTGPDYFLQITDNNSEHPVRELIKESLKLSPPNSSL